ncbi:hypothetical protein DDB_G0272777 [Dictyostelium discoideum AX4]|uniref:AAA+ ATPase domain-containing protein n=1 Tax=Dictyostelium discoideum TaxID=44689 RepID=Q86B10_DICDI|nr:hypothetical protein DDB_G0272777 [Dictyostelium discoideum AX4]EAL71026.1 hypothetical protein DDB_G0272777 [Dictyostelium discoideum AX4]|eukprot:XP_644963.1 hypothetical protein DDB_G0272777 [Dictyostelium discoideum AX4]
MTVKPEFIFNENVQYNQIKCNTKTIESLKLSSYQYIKLFISDKHCLIVEVIPDVTIEDNTILLSNQIINKIGNKNQINRYSFNFEPIEIISNNNNNKNKNNVTITIKNINSPYNGKILNNSIKRFFSYKPIIKDCEYLCPMVGNMCIFRVVDIKRNNNNSNNNNNNYGDNDSSFEHIQEFLENNNNINEIIIMDDNTPENKELNIELIDIKEQVEQLSEFLKLKFNTSFSNNNNKYSNQLNFLKSKGILIDGPEGTSKLQLIEYIAQQYNYKYLNLNELVNGGSGGGGGEQLNSKEPMIYILNNLDSIVGKISDNENSYQKKVIQRLTNFIDHIKSNEIILSTCTSVENIDQSITRAGRIDKFIHLTIPTQSKRMLILSNLLKNTPLQYDTNNNNDDIDQCKIKDKEQFIVELSKITPGFLFKDLTKLCRTVSLLTVSSFEEEEEEENENEKEIKISFKIFKEALKFIKPSTLINFDVTVQNVKWDRIGGYKQVKERFRQLIEWPLKYQDTFKRLSLNNSSGLLLHGPSGCGKSLMVKAIATEMSINFISIKGSDIYSKWLGESERIIRDLFKSARLSSPCIMFFDEIDSLTLSRGSGDDNEDGGTSKRILSQLLNEMDGIQVKSQIFLIGCTNSIQSIDSALLRPGRFESLIHIDLPSLDDRLDILNVLSTNSLNFNKDEITQQVWLDIATQTSGFTGSQLYDLCNQAGIIQLETDIVNSQSISKQSLYESLNKLKN